ncbi:quinolinate synthase A [Bacteroidia bacterium]|nr:quinolinate synthase A [Bacteroidia bacterium]
MAIVNNNLVAKIERLKKQKNAIILAHYYTLNDVQDIADVVGDSLALAQEAEHLQADIVVMCGVRFMAETVKILAPNTKVLLPDWQAGCSLAESCQLADFEQFKQQHPDHIVVSYVNTTADIKSLTDICCTSSNALAIVNSLPKDAKIIFAPDKNLGNYINAQTGRNMLLWDGACHVHEQFSVESIVELKQQYPQAKVLAHPECKKQVLLLADKIGSTAALLAYTQQSPSTQFLIATEAGILHQMQKLSPQKQFIPVPPVDSTCGCTDCNYMKLNTLQKIADVLEHETNEILMDENLRQQAQKSIVRMLKISNNNGNLLNKK